MRGTLRHRRWRLLAFLGVSIYAVFLVTVPFEHHDLLCHLKTPQHCTSCSSSLVGSDPDLLAFLATFQLRDAGTASAFQPLPESTLLAVRSTGRSPPTIV
jgi:hypothetical protein